MACTTLMNDGVVAGTITNADDVLPEETWVQCDAWNGG